MLNALLSNLSFYIPEAILILTLCGALLVESTYYVGEKGRGVLYSLGFIGLSLSLFALFKNFSLEPVKIFANAVTIDQFSTMAKVIMVMGTMGCLYVNMISTEIEANTKGEFSIMAIAVLIGGMLLASSNNMLTLYLGVEILSILSYVMASMRRDNAESNEAGLKYVLYGGVSAGIMLFGISHIYGMTGSIQFDELANQMANIDGSSLWLVMASFVLFFVGLGYKIATVPFHMWSPDVYEGSPIQVTSFFALVPKMAGLAVLIRVTLVMFNKNELLETSWIGLVHTIAAMTMLVGNISAIGQTSVKRLLAFSSIGHVGMMLMGILVMTQTGSGSVLFYMFSYIFMTLVAFLVTAHISNTYGSDSKIAFKGLIQRSPVLAIVMIITLFSLAGLPPLSGFVAKFNILSAAIESKFYGLSLIAAISSVIALYYYMVLIKTMVFDAPELEAEPASVTFKHKLALIGLSIPVVLLGIFWGDLLHFAQGAKVFL